MVKGEIQQARELFLSRPRENLAAIQRFHRPEVVAQRVVANRG